MVNALPLSKKLRIQISNAVDAFGMFTHHNACGFRILLYHSVTEKLIEDDRQENTVFTELFRRQLKYLVENKYNIVSCETVVGNLIDQEAIPPRTVAIAFDDGYRNICNNALPVLKEYNICATVFLTLDFLNGRSQDSCYISISDLPEIKKTGFIDFGCHGKTHKILSALNEKELDKEIFTAKAQLERLTESKIKLFAYPYGHTRSYNDMVIEKVKSAGFTGAFTNIFGLNDLGQNRFLLRRDRISWLDELPEFQKHLNGSYDWSRYFEFLRHKRYK